MSRIYSDIMGSSKSEKGAVLVTVAVLLIVFLAFTAMAIDVSHLYVVKNELQNAADAGALAGARRLINTDGSINLSANQYAYDAALANKSEGIAVEVDWTSGSNEGDVQRGHWSFGSRTFTPNANENQLDFWNVESSVLDQNTNFINAVRVRTRRQDTQAASVFARVLGFVGFNVSAEAVAYLGFAGTIEPYELDQPIAICKQSLTDADGKVDCNMGRMSNSGSDSATHNTAAWTNFTLSCDTATNPTVLPLVCRESGSNPISIPFGSSIGSTGGELDKISASIRSCFGPTTRTDPWELVLPVIDCPRNNPGKCSKVLGAVKVNVVWVADKDVKDNNLVQREKDFQDEGFPPSRMGDWECNADCSANTYPRSCCWDDFVSHFNLKNVDGADATYQKKAIYFLPSCTPVEPRGVSGGQNFGIQALIPVLVN